MESCGRTLYCDSLRLVTVTIAARRFRCDGATPHIYRGNHAHYTARLQLDRRYNRRSHAAYRMVDTLSAHALGRRKRAHRRSGHDDRCRWDEDVERRKTQGERYESSGGLRPTRKNTHSKVRRRYLRRFRRGCSACQHLCVGKLSSSIRTRRVEPNIRPTRCAEHNRDDHTLRRSSARFEEGNRSGGACDPHRSQGR